MIDTVTKWEDSEMVKEVLALADQLKTREDSGQQISKAFHFRRRFFTQP